MNIYQRGNNNGFPHYMWGYIGYPRAAVLSRPVPSLYVRVYRIPYAARIISAVPSLYVRVYRIPYAARMSHMCSLIICEGISAKAADIGANCTFPHYMWGYIASARHQPRSGRVPSLYVRVYRPSNERYGPEGSSLIICEGISDYGTMKTEEPEFPHYMWGYIAVVPFGKIPQTVPSLYVRVYRIAFISWNGVKRSLIICEGISYYIWLSCVIISFPHYMWGYIVFRPAGRLQKPVPSLYVRVYRKDGYALTVTSCSLIICEGISVIHEENLYTSQFPHYMWGYIERYWGLYLPPVVPSLYVRVYRDFSLGDVPQRRSLIICEGISVPLM